MNPWLDGLSALADRAATTTLFLFVIAWGIFVMRGILFRLSRDALDESDLPSLGAAGWALPVLILSLITFSASSLFNVVSGGIIALILILLSAFILRNPFLDTEADFTDSRGKNLEKSVSVHAIRALKKPPHIPIAIALLIPTLILRFAFIRDLSLPSYFDSAEHYRLIQSIVETYQTGAPSHNPGGGYYHPGYHHILAPLAYFFKQDIAELMLVSGPLFLALLPFSFYFIVKRETDSTPAALFACLLAGFGFHMPAHLMNWGKYPALLSLFFIPFVISLAYLHYQSNTRRKQILPLLALAVAASTLIHSRTLIVYSLTLPAALLALGWGRLRNPYRAHGFILLLALIAVEIFFIHQNPALKTLLESYLKNDLPILILLPALILPSAHRFPRRTFFLLSWLALAGLCLFIPIRLPILEIQTPLDRPFIQMFAIVPLSLLGGFGLSGLIHALARLTPDLKWIQRFAPILLFGLILLNAALTVDLYPSACCRFVARDDLAALAWLDESTPPDAKILVASTGLYVTSFESPKSQTGVDAGIWIPALLSRPVQLSGADIRFDLAQTHIQLCNDGVDYIYVGGTAQSFDPAQLENRPAWHLSAFALPSAKIYQLTGCDG